MRRSFEHAAVVGVGLIGGSLAMAARARGLVRRVTGVGRSEENLAVAVDRGIIDCGTRDFADVGPVDLVVLAVPVRSVVALARALAPRLRPGTIVTDVASVKEPIVEGIGGMLAPAVPFVGGHPIAGTEKRGAASALPDLFVGARCVLTPTDATDAAALARVRALWEGVGAEVEEMTPAAHDQTLAWTSHLVHVLAFGLARAVGRRDANLLRFAGPSFRDATRVAASDPEAWLDILLANADPVADVIRELGATLERVCDSLVARDEEALAEILRAGHAARKTLEERKG